MKKITKIILSVVLSLGLIYFLLSKIELKQIYLTLSNASPFYLMICFFVYLLMGIIRAWRFKILLKDLLNFREMLNITFFHNFMNNIIPFRIGELSYVYLIKKIKNGSYAQGLSSLIIARIFDFISLVLVFFVSLFFSANFVKGIKFEILILITGSLLILTLLLSYLLIFKQKHVYSIAKGMITLFRNVNKALSVKMNTGVKKLFKNFEEVKDTKEIFLFFFSSLLITLLSFTFTFFMVMSLGYNVPYGVVVIASSLSIISSLLPVYGVAGLGTVEGVWVLVLSYFNFGLETAIVLSFSFHIIQLIYSILFGIAGWYNLRKSLY